MNCVLKFIVLLVHLIIIGFIVLTPFVGNTYLLIMHALVVPFIILHWVLKNNTCAIVIFEQMTREKITGCKIKSSDCISGKIVEPVYDFCNNYDDYQTVIYLSTIILWILGSVKLYRNFASGKIKSINDIIKV